MLWLGAECKTIDFFSMFEHFFEFDSHSTANIIIKMNSKLKNNETITHTLYQDVFSGLFFAELLGGEFPNCYGQGSTSKDAILSLKIRIYQLRNKKNNNVSSN